MKKFNSTRWLEWGPILGVLILPELSLGCHSKDQRGGPEKSAPPSVQMSVDEVAVSAQEPSGGVSVLAASTGVLGGILELKVVPEGAPGQAAEDLRAIPLEVVANESEIQIHTKLSLKDPEATEQNLKRDLFFSWPDRFRGRQIISALYTHRLEGAPREVLLGRNARLVRPDREANRMVIPFSEIFENLPNYSESSSTSEHSHLIDLELTLDGGELSRVQIVFQTIGPLPQLIFTELPIPDLEIRQKAQAAAGAGLELRRERIENPVDRSLRVWLKASVEPISIWHLISEPVVRLILNEGPRQEAPIPRGSRGRLTIQSVEVRRVGHEAQVIVLDHRGVGFFDLAPQETVEISWKAGKTPDSMACSIPERIRQSFNWMGEIRLGAHGVSFMLPIPQQKEVELNWEMSAVVVEGRWSREVRVAHLFVLAGQAMGVTSREGLSPENQFQNYRVFETVEQNYGLPESFDRRAQETRNLMNCQGFFP